MITRMPLINCDINEERDVFRIMKESMQRDQWHYIEYCALLKEQKNLLKSNRRGAVVKRVEHISTIVLVNIWVARVRVPLVLLVGIWICKNPIINT